MTQTTPSTSAQGPVAWRYTVRGDFNPLRRVSLSPTYVQGDIVEVEPLGPLTASPSPAASDASPSGVRVKPLEYVKPHGSETLLRAETILGEALVWTHHEANGQWFWKLGKDASGTEASEADCKRMLWATYEHRILSALASDASPASPSGSEESFVTNCVISTRGGETIFTSTEHGIVATMDRYAIIPLEDYKRLASATAPAPTSGSEDGPDLATDFFRMTPREVHEALAKPASEPAGGDVREADVARALDLLRAHDERQTKLHELLETIREQIRLGVKHEHRPEGLFKNIQDAVYAMRGRTQLMNDAAITAALSSSAGPAEPVAWRWRVKGRDDWNTSPDYVSARMMAGLSGQVEHLYTHPAPVTVESAVVAEREACAKLCDRRRKKDAEFEGGRNSYSHFSSLTARDLANEIRARAALAPATEARTDAGPRS